MNIHNLFLGNSKFTNPNLTKNDKEKFKRVVKIQKRFEEIDQKLRTFCSVKTNTERKLYSYAIMLLYSTGIRVGNEGSAEGYISTQKKFEGQLLKTYGLTTLKHDHISFEFSIPGIIDTKEINVPKRMILSFAGKKNVDQCIVVDDEFLVKLGYEIWNLDYSIWLSLSKEEPLSAYYLTKFIKKTIGKDFTPKDFRAYRANIEAATISKSKLTDRVIYDKKKEVKQELKFIVESVSKVLGNTPGIAKKAYINSEILYKHAYNRGFDVKFKKKNDKRKEMFIKRNNE